MIAVESEGAGLVIPVLMGIAEEVAAPVGKSKSPETLNGEELPDAPGDRDLCLYRARTLAMLRRYARMSVEAGRLPSLLGRELFTTRRSEYRVASFEDCVIFVHDIWKSLEKLDMFSRRLIETVVLQDYSQEEAAAVLGCRRRTVVRLYPEALDRLSEILLKGGLLERLPEADAKEAVENGCQEAERSKYPASYYKDGDNNSDRNVSFSHSGVI